MNARQIIRKVRRLEIRTRRLVDESLAGSYHSMFRGRGMEFAEVRAYSLGDDVRTIDWNVSARMGHPFVKIFTEERELTVVLVVDASGSKGFGTHSATKLELSAEIAAMLAFSEAAGIRIRQGYGSTEAGLITINMDDDVDQAWESVGPPTGSVDLEIVDDDDHPVGPGVVGEIRLRGSALSIYGTRISYVRIWYRIRTE